MRTAETVLNVIRDRGERGLPLEDIYRQLYNRELYLRAYGRLYSNQGAMTKGTTAETVDGMPWQKSTASSTSFVTSGFDGRRCDGSIFPSLSPNPPKDVLGDSP